MGVPQSEPVRFTPKGLADAFDATDVFPGACRTLTNLVFNPSNPEIMIPRPGVGTAETDFSGFSSPGFVSVHAVVGTQVFGMVATALTAGKDQPFCYDLVTQAFVAVAGCTAGNAEGRPTSPATSGAWTPPTMAVIGAKLIITHPGYSGGGTNFFGVIDLTNPAVPAYSTTNTSSHALPSVPTGVANFNNRAYFICGNRLYYSDVLVPTTMTNAGQSLTLGDSSSMTALAGLPIQTTSAGVVSALLAFKATQIWQITGDAAISGSLSQNYLSLSVGTTAPRSLASSPLGTFFAGPDTAYLVNVLGSLSPVVNQLGALAQSPDIQAPFANITEPTRAAASFAGTVYRVCMPTIIDGNETTNDYWFDTRRMRWTGPHSFAYDCASSAGTYFILSGAGSTGKLFNSDIFPNVNTVYNDDAVNYIIDMRSSDFPKKAWMAMKSMVESTIELSVGASAFVYNIYSYDDKGNGIDYVTVTTPAVGTAWGTNNWGDGTLWQSSLKQPRTFAIPWSIPIVFNRLSIQVECTAAKGVGIGTFYGRWEKLGYTLDS